MIYAIAAYTITAGALALYGVLLQHRGRVYLSDQELSDQELSDHTDCDQSSTGPRQADHEGLTDGSGGARQPGFNLGAALLSPIWMWAHGLRVPGVILLVCWAACVPLYERALFIPLLFVGMLPLAAGAALGFVGNRIAIAHRGPESLAAFSSSQLPWATVGVAFYTIVLPWLWYTRYAGG